MSESATADVVRLSLREHRRALAANADAYEGDLPRVRGTAVGHLRACGYPRLTLARCPALVSDFVDLIFATQGRRPFFHIEAPLPFCWNTPKDWAKDYIRYEWGHLYSRNQSGGVERLEDLCLQSARCNQHVQTSMNIDEVLEWLAGSRVAKRIESVLERRRELFASTPWRDLLRGLEEFAA